MIIEAHDNGSVSGSHREASTPATAAAMTGKTSFRSINVFTPNSRFKKGP
jgi:hypothetical protein